MDSRDVERLSQLVEFQSRLTQATIAMAGMIAEK